MNMENAREDLLFNRLVSQESTLSYMLAKVRGIFSYEGLPLTVPRDVLEGYLTQSGQAVIYEHEGDLFVSDTAPDSEPDVYGRNTHVTIHHRIGGVTTTLERTIGVDAVLIENDPEHVGLQPLLEEYATLMAQAKLSFLTTFVNMRNPRIIQAKDQNAAESAMQYENSLRAGEISVLLAEELGDMSGVVVHPTPMQGTPASQVIELAQYIQSMYYGELGLDVNNNMKRTYVSEAELQKTTGAPLLDVMLDCRETAIAAVNALFDREIVVTIDNDWSGETNEEPQSDEATGSAEEPTQEDGAEGGTAEEDPIQDDEEEHEVTAEEVIDAAEAVGSDA